MKKNEDKIKILENEIIKKNKEIENYKSNIYNFNNNNNLGFSITSIKPGEKIILLVWEFKILIIIVYHVKILIYL